MCADEKILENLMRCYPELEVCRTEIVRAYEILETSFRAGGKLLLCGNGGSAADCEHIAGELLKGFLKKRPLPDRERAGFENLPDGQWIADRLQGALPCISLIGSPALRSAFVNDVDPLLDYAQLVYGYGRPGDVLLGISTSGNAANVRYAVITAKARGLMTIGLSGKDGGELAKLCDCTVIVPSQETYRIQEYHLPIYHALCAMLEEAFFDVTASE